MSIALPGLAVNNTETGRNQANKESTAWYHLEQEVAERNHLIKPGERGIWAVDAAFIDVEFAAVFRAKNTPVLDPILA
jgi:hypothetical protein